MDIGKLNEMMNGFSRRMEETLGGRLKALYLFGSVMIAENYHPGISDINTLIVFDDNAETGDIGKTRGVYQEFKKYPFAIPLMLKEHEIQDAADVFAVEFIEIQENNRLLRGKDIFKELNISLEDIRTQCETEIRAKIIGLRKMIFAEKELMKQQDVLYKSLTSTIVLLKQALRLKKEQIPASRAEIINSLKTVFSNPLGGIENLYLMRTRSEKITKNIMDRLMRDYLRDLEFFGEVFNEKI